MSFELTTKATNKVKLLEQVRISLRTNHYSPKTEESYVGWIGEPKFVHRKKHLPVVLTKEEVKSIE